MRSRSGWRPRTPGRLFRPAPGTVTGLQVPSGPWLRADLGVAAGDRVPRGVRLDVRQADGLGSGSRERRGGGWSPPWTELRVGGLPSTAPYLREVLGQPAFIRGEHATTTLEEHWQPDPEHATRRRRDPCPGGPRPESAPPDSPTPDSTVPG